MSVERYWWRHWFKTEAPAPPPRPCLYPSRAGKEQPQPTFSAGTSILGASLLIETTEGVLVVPIGLSLPHAPLVEGNTITFERLTVDVGPGGACRDVAAR